MRQKLQPSDKCFYFLRRTSSLASEIIDSAGYALRARRSYRDCDYEKSITILDLAYRGFKSIESAPSRAVTSHEKHSPFHDGGKIGYLLVLIPSERRELSI